MWPRDLAPGAAACGGQRSHPRPRGAAGGRSSDCRSDGIEPDAVRHCVSAGIARRARQSRGASVRPAAIRSVIRARGGRRRSAAPRRQHRPFAGRVDCQHERGVRVAVQAAVQSRATLYWFRSQAIRCSTISPRSRVLPRIPTRSNTTAAGRSTWNRYGARLRTSARCWSCRPTTRPGRSSPARSSSRCQPSAARAAGR